MVFLLEIFSWKLQTSDDSMAVTDGICIYSWSQRLCRIYALHGREQLPLDLSALYGVTTRNFDVGGVCIPDGGQVSKPNKTRDQE